VQNRQMFVVSAVRICKHAVSANCFSFWEIRTGAGMETEFLGLPMIVTSFGQKQTRE